MTSGIYVIAKDNGKVISFIQRNALKMEETKEDTYLLYNEGIHRIKCNIHQRKLTGEIHQRIEIDSTPENAKIPKELEELLIKYNSY